MLLIGKPAIWRTNEVDIPVVIQSVAGKFHGETYYYVKGTADGSLGKTGVPESELYQKKSNPMLDKIRELRTLAETMLEELAEVLR